MDHWIHCSNQFTPQWLDTLRWLCSPPAHLRDTPRSKGVGEPPLSRGYVATRPTCGPLLMPPRALKRREPPRQQAVCSHPAHLWATFDSAPCCEAPEPPKQQALCSHRAHLWATFDSANASEAVGTPHTADIM